MINTKHNLDGAIIKPYGDKMIEYKGREQSINIYRIISTSEKDIFFECPFEWAENGYDFWVTILNFGTFSPNLSGSKGSWFRQKFKPTEIVAAKKLIES